MPDIISLGTVVTAEHGIDVVAAEPQDTEYKDVFDNEPQVDPAFVPDDFKQMQYHDSADILV
jgi:hypothetical protein